MKDWYVYILKCSDESLYTGITKDINKRLYEHNNTKTGASYTKGRRPCFLLYQEGPMDKSSALKREISIKKITRKEKLELVGIIDKNN